MPSSTSLGITGFLAACTAGLAIITAAAQAPSPSAGVVGPHLVVGPNIRVSAADAKDWRNECWLAASTKSPFLVAVSQRSMTDALAAVDMPCMTAVSRNGGQTWREVSLPKQEDGFDPMAVAGPDGRIYVMQGLLGRNAGMEGMGILPTHERGAIRIWSTTDEGHTWDGPTDIACPVQPDHPRLVVDQTDGPHRGRLFVLWNEVVDTVLKDRFHLFLNYSDDGGKTFSEPVLIDAREGGKLVATEPVVLSDGSVLAPYFEYFFPYGTKKNEAMPYIIARSSDGGQTFNKPEQVFTFGHSAWPYLQREAKHTFPLPIVVADTSKSSRFRDRVYVVWDDVVTSGVSTIWLRWSEDQGRSWSKPIRINDNRPAPAGGPFDYRMTPVVAVNKDGTVGVAWYDRRDDPTRRCWRQYFSASLDGGATWLPNVAVSSAPSCPGSSPADPMVSVLNVDRSFDENLPTEMDLQKGDRIARLLDTQEIELERAFRDTYKDVKTPQLLVTFNAARNVWPGHYTGLAVDADGRFRVLWSDRRSGTQQIYTAPVEVVQGAPPPVVTREAAVTDMVQVLAGPAKHDATKGTTTFELQIRNVSDKPIYGPIRLRVTKIRPESAPAPAGAKVATKMPPPAVVVVDADSGGTGVGATWDFSKLIGGFARLDPRMVSEARPVTVKTAPEAGLDGTLEFEVIGHVPETRTNDALGHR